MRSLFIDDQDQLRSGWRALIFLLAFAFLAVVLGSLAQISLSILNLEAPPGSPINLTVNALASLTAALLIGWLCGKLLEKLPFRAMGASLTSRSVFNLMAGLLLGSTTIGLAVFIAYAFGGLRFELDHEGGQTVVSSLLTSLAVFAAAAAF